MSGQPALTNADFDTTVTFDPMPTTRPSPSRSTRPAKDYSVTLTARNAADTAGQTTSKIEVLSERNDGLTIVGTAHRRPHGRSLELGLGASRPRRCRPSISTSRRSAQRRHPRQQPRPQARGHEDGGGFLNTADFLGYNLGYVAVTGKQPAGPDGRLSPRDRLRRRQGHERRRVDRLRRSWPSTTTATTAPSSTDWSMHRRRPHRHVETPRRPLHRRRRQPAGRSTAW